MRLASPKASSLALVPALCAALAGACAGGSTQPTPVASVASTVPAAAAFAAIRETWGDPDEGSPATLRPMLERFLAQFPSDGLVPVARVALALVAMEQGDFETADVQLARTEGVPTGTAQDLRTVARARRLRSRDNSEAALSLLRPLVGKNVDPLARSVFEKELTLDALATHRDYEAISYMDAWLRATPEEERAQTAKAVMGIVRELPRDVLEAELQTMRSEGESLGYGVEIERILAARLVEIATTTGDARLARLLLDPDAGAIVATGEAGADLFELATSRRGLNVVDGRTVGLLLPTESPGLRDEAADVLRGTMWALGLPRGVRARAAASAPPADAGVGAAAPPRCAPLEPAPDLAEPSPQGRLHLLTRDDAGNIDRTELSLDELAGAGAAIIVAGLDGQTAARALRWSEAHGVPLIALVPPEDIPAEWDGGAGAATPAGAGPGSFGFVLGAKREEVLGVLARTAPGLTGGGVVVVPVIDTGQAALYPLQGGHLGPFALDPPVSCDIPPVRAGEPRFPVGQWEHDKRHAWLVSGSPGCSLDVAAELAAAHQKGVVALTLEAAALPARPAGLRVVTASAGVIPESGAVDARDDELRRFSSTLGRVSWWTALGRDAVTLARVALEQLPTDLVSDARTVAERRALARDRLENAAARLWSTEASGWAKAHQMRRTLCAVDAPATTR